MRRSCKLVKKELSAFCFMITLSLFLLIVLIGCTDKETSENDVAEKESKLSRVEKKTSVVAKIGDSVVSASDLKAYVADRPPSSRSGFTNEDILKRLDNLVVEKVLYQEALRQNLDQDPEMQRRICQLLTQKLIDEQVNKRAWTRPITEAEIKAYYDRHQLEYNRPEQVRLADIFISVPPDASDKKRDELKARAQQALAEAFKIKQQRFGFGSLIRKYSDVQGNYPKGDTGFFDRKGQPVGVDVKLAEAAFNLTSNGSIPEQVIETPQGYHVVMRIGKRSAIHKSLDDVRPQIERRIRRQEVKQKRREYIENLKKEADIQINDQVVANVTEEIMDSLKKHDANSNKKIILKGSKADALLPKTDSRN